ncbi:sporulation protein YunB [Orenia marismortui]|uniref:Sporulation protein YunB n=1 Tax=Orenia marismortui TaxID=46469 RepID=A0A4V3GX79_9FIRM|nr:sporulation protein YunB [Orenia marismortui]TDX46789.1 sporulation protein YunB [Orenia marismortui]
MLFFFNRFLKIGLIVLISILILSVFLIETTLQPILRDVCKTDVTGMLTNIINKAVNNETNTFSYNKLVSIKTNRQGHIILMQPNLQIVNDLSSNITLSVQQALENLDDRLISIPISQIFGIEILSKFSPKFKAHIVPYGSVKSNIIDEFESVGINQTRHKIYLEVQTKVRVVVPLTGADIDVTTQIPLTEAVIVGQVPQVYVGVEEGLFENGIIKKKE